MFSLQILRLYQNEIVDIHDKALKGLNRLVILDISQNKLINAPTLSYVKNTLEELDISWNRIGHISDTYFNLCKKMRIIHLQYNQLLEIPNLRSISHTIDILSLDGNKITSAVPLYGIHFPRLRTVQLNFNQLTHFCFLPANFVPHLQEVYLASNNLSRMSFSQTNSSIKHEVLMILGSNPWHCNESLGWTQQCTPMALDDMLCMGRLHVSGMICASPPNATGLLPSQAGMICFAIQGFLFMCPANSAYTEWLWLSCCDWPKLGWLICIFRCAFHVLCEMSWFGSILVKGNCLYVSAKVT